MAYDRQMKKIKFPIANVSSKNWDSDEDVYILFDEYIYSKDEVFFKKDFLNNAYVDSNGEVFKITDRILPNRVRQILSFLPNFCKVELIFTETGENMTIEAIRSHIIRQVEKLEKNEITTQWIKNVRNASTIEHVISGEDTRPNAKSPKT